MMYRQARLFPAREVGGASSMRREAGAATLILLRLLERHAPELPAPIPELRFLASRRWRFDLAWPDARVAVELDGGVWLARGGRHARDTDRYKLNAAAALGWRVFRFSPQMLRDDGEACIRLLAQTIARGPQQL